MLETFRPLLDAAHGLDLARPKTAVLELNARLDPASERARALEDALKELFAAGKIADRGLPPVRFGRVAKASPQSLELSIDVVVMEGPGPLHSHPQGEVNYCLPLEGTPSFEGQTHGWVVMPPGSSHVPAVSGGKMLIVYLLPRGAIEFAV
jgi:hypothetical protein